METMAGVHCLVSHTTKKRPVQCHAQVSSNTTQATKQCSRNNSVINNSLYSLKKWMIVTVYGHNYLTAAKVRPEKQVQAWIGFTCTPMTSAILVQCRCYLLYFHCCLSCVCSYLWWSFKDLFRYISLQFKYK